MSSRFAALCLIGAGLIQAGARAQSPYGLDARAPIGPYLNHVMPPRSGEFAFPPVLSATGAFSDVRTLTPATGVIPFTVNSPLWSDGAIKSRWVAVPNDGPPYSPDEQIRFAPTGEWTFPNGTVFIKNFDLTVNEATGERKRLETRLLVRDANGAVYGVTYKWRADNSDADLLPGGLDENIGITDKAGQVRTQKWSYPSRADCLFCHNQPASYVLGLKTHQLNGDFTYPGTGRTDNQLRTFSHVGLLNPAPSEVAIPTLLKSVSVSNTSVPVQYRMRSWIDSNCSQCHRPGGFCPSYDARFATPLEKQNLINTFVKFRDLSGSELYQRDNALDQSKMPPLAKNVVHEAAMANLRQWIASPLEVLSIYLFQDTAHLAVRFNSHVDPETATVLSNYALDQGATITAAALGAEADTVILTVASVAYNQTYVLTTTGVQDTAPSANTIWPYSPARFVAQYSPVAASTRLANLSSRIHVAAGDDVAITGFIVRGGTAKRAMLRALGPSLSSSRIVDAVADPILELHDSTGGVLATNDNWADNANQQEIIDTGIAPKARSESVILAKLASDDNGVRYTAILREAGGRTGTGLLELYDLDRGLGSDLLNISTRAKAGSGDSVLIGGFIIGQGTNSPGLRVVVRALGPSLSAFGVWDPLSDPTLELRDANGGLLQSNNNWKDTQRTEIEATGLAPNDELESALVITLPPNGYTAIVRDVADNPGVGVVEVFALK